MIDGNGQTDGIEDEDRDDLCDATTGLEEHEITSDEELPPATGGVED